jgi:hypothetical protein
MPPAFVAHDLSHGRKRFGQHSQSPPLQRRRKAIASRVNPIGGLHR